MENITKKQSYWLKTKTFVKYFPCFEIQDGNNIYCELNTIYNKIMAHINTDGEMRLVNMQYNELGGIVNKSIAVCTNVRNMERYIEKELSTMHDIKLIRRIFRNR